MRVDLKGESSEETAIESGVPQGTVLGPLLFLCHINNPSAFIRTKVHLFADDFLLYQEISSIQDHLVLQEELHRLELWANKWGITQLLCPYN